MNARTAGWLVGSFFLLAHGFQAPAATPIHAYSFESGVVTDSIGGADGTLLQGATIQSGELALDGIRQYVEFGEALIPTQGSFSIAFFAQEADPTSDRAEVISQGSWFGPGFYIGYYPPSRTLRVGDEWQNTGLTFPDDGLRHHFALTVDEDNGTLLYMDGFLAASTKTIHIAPGGYLTRLGRQYNPWSEYFHGAVDDLWIFSGALTPTEAGQLAAGRPTTQVLPVQIAQVQLAVNTEKQVTYQLQYRSSTTTNLWTDLGRTVRGTGHTVYVTDSTPEPDRKYRAVEVPAKPGAGPRR